MFLADHRFSFVEVQNILKHFLFLIIQEIINAVNWITPERTKKMRKDCEKRLIN